MAKPKCHICKAKNKEDVCKQCGINLFARHTEKLILTSSGYTYLDYNSKKFNQYAIAL